MQRVPALGPPTLGDTTAVEHDMVSAGLGEQPAYGETGVAGADHDGVDGVHDDPLERAAGRSLRWVRPARAGMWSAVSR